MNIDSYDLDKLRKLVRNLEKENKSLKKLLNEANISYEENDYFLDEEEDNYDIEQSERIINRNISDKMANEFFYLFQGRKDVYARRGRNGGYFPQCENSFNEICPRRRKIKTFCENCEHKKWKSLDLYRIKRHLIGERVDDVIGIYPLFPDDTCRFIVFDFDNHEKGKEKDDYANSNDKWKQEVNALRKICELSGIKPLVERSRSGNGAHLWILFSEPIKANIARNFGFLLLDKGMSLVNIKSFDYYDRMYPCQDHLKNLGNLIALPLQGDALKRGNSAFVDEDFNAYPDQWSYIFKQSKRLSKDEVLSYILNWQNELAHNDGKLINFNIEDRPKPWRRNIKFNKENVVGKLHIVLADGVYVDTLNITVELQNQIRSLAAFDNPIYYKNKNLGYSNYYNLSSVYLGKDIDGYINIPRGLKEKLIEKCNEACIEYDIEDNREKGRPIRVSFKQSLRDKQDLAANDMFNYENGILDAATGFGKTVIATYLIGKRKTNTLIILQNTELIDQWIKAINDFLDINEIPREYLTKTGKKKSRDSVIGILSGSKNSLSGIIDIAMVGSLYKKGDFNEFINSYGMVIVDECHHSAANTFIEVLKKVNAKYVYGFSATLKRSDQLDKITYMMIGPIRHQYTAMQRFIDNGIKHYIVPRFTKVFDFSEDKDNINRLYELVCFNKNRINQIVEDVKECVNKNRTSLILTKYKKQADMFYESLKDSADYVYVIYGDNTQKENREIREKLYSIDSNKTLILIATAQKIGEGFDFPRLDTLFLSLPVSHESRLSQYVGRIDRIYKGKKDVYVYDYIDFHIGVFENMYKKRLKTYKKNGFNVYQKELSEKQDARHIYGYNNYTESFEQDIIEASKRIIISSPELSKDKVDRFIELINLRLELGIEATIIAVEKDTNYEIINELRNNGVNIILKDELYKCFAIIDDEFVWYGGVNLLGKDDVWDNVIRIKDEEVVGELVDDYFNEETDEQKINSQDLYDAK